MFEKKVCPDFMLEEKSVPDFMFEKKVCPNFMLEEKSVPDFMRQENLFLIFMLEAKSVPDFMLERKSVPDVCWWKATVRLHLHSGAAKETDEIPCRSQNYAAASQSCGVPRTSTHCCSVKPQASHPR